MSIIEHVYIGMTYDSTPIRPRNRKKLAELLGRDETNDGIIPKTK